MIHRLETANPLKSIENLSLPVKAVPRVYTFPPPARGGRGSRRERAAGDSRCQPVQQARERYRLTHVPDTADVGQCAFYAEPETGMREGTVASEIEVPFKRLSRQVMLGESPLEECEVVDALPPADLEKARGKRIYWVHGALDWMFRLEIAQRDAKVLEQMGADITLRVVYDLSHTYPRDENARILEWFGISMT